VYVTFDVFLTFEDRQSDRRLDITETHNEMEVQFSYSVEWTKEEMEWKDRHAKYSESAFPSSLEIHWLSIINSFVLVLLLTAFLTIIMLRILKNDFSRYMEMEEEAIDEEEVRNSRDDRCLNSLEFCCCRLDGSLFTAMSFASRRTLDCFAPRSARETTWSS
jgi:hypothetical protein